MPTFSNIEISTTVDVDFEVYCGTCGYGLCGESDTRHSYRRGYAQVTVNACPNCMKKKDDEITDLNDRIKELEKQLEER